ncbi:beta-lactamase domain protein (plasmid) [Halobacterium hubeiense]|uniref:Beta-lactamase domain protein n=1 Tax=Halobacterium hubeiense TaxID=1407499 RepID=A0A0U5D1C8_9EURY|nr:MBL fold metallo-hydrolase [Halobacterium hubeiense]CQH63259.1 beta-lactamase domain protein [Halobacterium hubeiense]
MRDTETTTIAPGITRVETVIDGKIHGYHVLDGANGPVIVDPGVADAPTTVYEPALEADGWTLADVSLALITHADADHHGGNEELREHAPSVTLAAHETDADLMESVDALMDERYGMFADDHGITYDKETRDWLDGMIGAGERIDLRLRGGEQLALADRELDVLHTPGHTRGHLVLYDATHDVVVGGDAVFGRGVFTVDDEYIQPPPYYLYPAYQNTIELLRALDADTLSLTHYEVFEGEAVDAFLDESLAFASEVDALALDLVDAEGPLTLREAIDAFVERRGSYGLDADLAYPLSGHFAAHVDRGNLERTTKDGLVAWQKA